MYATTTRSRDDINTFVQYAKVLNDAPLLERLQNTNAVDYHTSCKTLYQKRCDQKVKQTGPQGEWNDSTKFLVEGLESLSVFLQKEVLQDGKIYFLQDVYVRYQYILTEISDLPKEEFSYFTVQMLHDTILKQHGGEISIRASDTSNKKLIVFKKGIDVKALVEQGALEKTTEAARLAEVAFELRNSVKTMNKKKITEGSTADDILEDEWDIPADLLDFMSRFIKEPGTPRQQSAEEDLMIKSFCTEMISLVMKD